MSRPVDDALQSSLLFVQSHESSLREIECSVGDTVHPIHDEIFRPVAINLQPPERVLTMELINTGKEEKSFKKVLAVFAFPCDEIRELNDIAEESFYPKLLMFGSAASTSDGVNPPGQAEEQMGHMLPFFQVSTASRFSLSFKATITTNKMSSDTSSITISNFFFVGLSQFCGTMP